MSPNRMVLHGADRDDRAAEGERTTGGLGMRGEVDGGCCEDLSQRYLTLDKRGAAI